METEMNEVLSLVRQVRTRLRATAEDRRLQGLLGQRQAQRVPAKV